MVVRESLDFQDQRASLGKMAVRVTRASKDFQVCLVLSVKKESLAKQAKLVTQVLQECWGILGNQGNVVNREK